MRQLKITKQITNRTPTVEKYFSEVERQPLITQEQEIELARRIKAGDKEAEDILIKANLRFVISVAKKYATKGILLSDVINDGNVGLIKAAKKFDETRGFKFISYAVWWIRQSILEAYPTHKRSIRIPMNIQTVYDKVKKWSNEFEQKYEREPTIHEVCEEFNLEKSSYIKMLSHTGGEHSIDEKAGEDDDFTFADLMASDTIEIYEEIETQNSSYLINKALHICLNHVERDVICKFYGIGTPHKEGMSLDEIGNFYCLTSERIRQIKDKALKKMRANTTCRELLKQLLN